jgi:signal transduction histidine kinase
MFPLEESVFTAYVIAACWFLSRSFFSSTLRLEKVERYILTLLWGGLLYVSGRYLLLPFFQSGNYATPFYYINSTLFRFAETAVLALAMFMSLKTLSLHWLYLTQGIALLSISSIALGYNDGVLLGADVPFHEYGWFWGLLMILFAQTFRASSEVGVSKWSSVRVRMAGLVFIFNLTLLFVLYALRIFTTHNAFQLTSMLFIIYGLWFVASLISYQLSTNIQEVLENIQAEPVELTPSRPRWNVYEVELLADKLSVAYATIKKQSRLAALTEIAAQVAHDIRSPLAALNVALQDMSALPEKRQELARGAMGRIGEIARDLLDNYKKPNASPAVEKPVSPQELKCLIEPVISEKRAQYASKPDITIEFPVAAENAKVIVQPAEFRRIISNLVNNAVEAFESGGRVTIELAKAGDKILLKIGDTGKGIPAAILAKLGQKGETHGKAGGTGLGLYHARTSVESWGGKLDIHSVVGKGTTVTIELPAIDSTSPSASPDVQGPVA